MPQLIHDCTATVAKPFFSCKLMPRRPVQHDSGRVVVIKLCSAGALVGIHHLRHSGLSTILMSSLTSSTPE
jgi:hypothetical protein